MNKQEWIAVAECHFCESVAPTKECFIYKYDGFVDVIVCKECHRDSQLIKLGDIFKSEKQE